MLRRGHDKQEGPSNEGSPWADPNPITSLPHTVRWFQVVGAFMLQRLGFQPYGLPAIELFYFVFLKLLFYPCFWPFWAFFFFSVLDLSRIQSPPEPSHRVFVVRVVSCSPNYLPASPSGLASGRVLYMPGPPVGHILPHDVDS